MEEFVNLVRHFVVSKQIIPSEGKSLYRWIICHDFDGTAEFGRTEEIGRVGEMDPFGVGTIILHPPIVLISFPDSICAFLIAIDQFDYLHSFFDPNVPQG